MANTIGDRERVITSDTIEQGEGMYPARIVLLKEPENTDKAKWLDNLIGKGHYYSTHIEAVPNDGRPAYMVSGNYDMTLDDALLDFQRRFARLQGVNRKGVKGNLKSV